MAEGSIPADTLQLGKLKHWEIDFFMLTMSVIKNEKVDLKFLSASSGFMHFFFFHYCFSEQLNFVLFVGT